MPLDEVPWEIVVLEIAHPDSLDLYNNNLTLTLPLKMRHLTKGEKKINLRLLVNRKQMTVSLILVQHKMIAGQTSKTHLHDLSKCLRKANDTLLCM